MKKIERKIRKHQNILLKDGIQVTETPTQNIAICNVGLVNGLSEKTLVESLRNFGEIEDLLMPHGKSYCFVRFTSVDNAKNCYNSCNAKLNIAQDSKPIYMSFIESLPTNGTNNEKIWNALPPGLILLENFIDESEENLLFNLLKFEDSLKNRQVRHFGYEFKYTINNIDRNEPLKEKIPVECDILWDRLGEKCDKFRGFLPDQLTINQYLPGQGIPSHIDTHSAFEEPIVSLSLGSPVVMEFKNENGLCHCVVLPSRSLLIMSEESRYSWAHGIVPKKYDFIQKNNKTSCDLINRTTRISYTFRKIRQTTECHCNFEKFCDFQLSKIIKSTFMDEKRAVELEKEHVHKVYENIADHFSETRHKPWPNVLEFIQKLDSGSILIDVGCGNGKYLDINKNIFNLGCDRTINLVDVCKQRGFETVTCDCLSLPFKDGCADFCICIAVIHHLATEERRLRALKEIIRVLRVKGKALIYVWAKNQVSNNKKSNYLKELKREQDKIGISSQRGFSLPVHTNRTQFEHDDILVPWKLKGSNEDGKILTTFLRFYHVYQENELKHDCAQFEEIEIISSYHDEGNWCILFRKINDMI